MFTPFHLALGILTLNLAVNLAIRAVLRRRRVKAAKRALKEEASGRRLAEYALERAENLLRRKTILLEQTEKSPRAAGDELIRRYRELLKLGREAASLRARRAIREGSLAAGLRSGDWKAYLTREREIREKHKGLSPTREEDRRTCATYGQ